MSSRIWTGSTGRALRAEPLEISMVEFWLFTNPTAMAEPYGIYLCEIDIAVAHIGPRRVTEAQVEQALQRLTQLGFCRYDPSSRYVWVVEMAAWQLLGNNLQPLPPKDWRAINAARWYANCYDNPHLGAFWDRYHRDLRLGERREGRVAGRSYRTDQSTLGFDLDGEEGGVGGGTPRKTQEQLDAERDAALRPGFDAWWAIYPKHVGKQEAWRAYREEQPPSERLMETTRAYLDSVEWAPRRDGSRAIKYPATFLREHCWEDEPQAAPRRRAAVGSPEYEARATAWRDRCAALGHDPECQTPTACRVKQAKEERNRDAKNEEETDTA